MQDVKIEKSIGLCKDFVENILKKTEGFTHLFEDGACDLLLLAGTTVERSKDNLSDVDIFLICKYEAQIKYSLKPVQIFNYKGEIFEVSVLSTEKIFNGRYNKDDIHWWHHTYIIESYSEKAEKALSQASVLSKKEFLDRLWTNFVYFKINTCDIEKQIKRGELLSVNLLFGENIKLVIDSELICLGEFPSKKQFGSVLKLHNEKLYKEILQAQKFSNLVELKLYNDKMETHLSSLLMNNDFSEEEIKDWENCNLTRITFQYR